MLGVEKAIVDGKKAEMRRQPLGIRVQVTGRAWYRFRRSLGSVRTGAVGANGLEYRVTALPFERIVYGAASMETHVRPRASSVRPNAVRHVSISGDGFPLASSWS